MPKRAAPGDKSTRTLALILGDQLGRGLPEHLGLDPVSDTLLMMEVRAESEHAASHIQRTVLFLSAMRHHAAWLRGQGWRVEYVELTDKANTHAFDTEIVRACERLRPKRIAAARPGEHRVLDLIEDAAERAGVPLEWSEDPHFLCTPEEFGAWASGRKELVMEFFYREQRRRLGLLMEAGGKKPIGGLWNFDKHNRGSFKTTPTAPRPIAFSPDAVTRAVIEDVRGVMPKLSGSIDAFNWPVTREQALEALDDFIERRLPKFGAFQDAMWTGERTLYHALISPAMNLKLLDPREVCQRATEAYESGHAPLNSVEGFIRQVIGWREFIRGVYWFEGEDYGERNELGHTGELPSFYWDAKTDMACMADAVGGVLELAYSHHISRLMVTGNFALIAGIEPKQVSDWYLGMYADGVDWVTLPNTLGMALHADGGVVGTKPYAASGKYIQRMGNACEHCRYDLSKRHGEDACPFNTFYWDFLIRHEKRFSKNMRMKMMLKHVQNMGEPERVQITVSADALRRKMGITPG